MIVDVEISRQVLRDAVLQGVLPEAEADQLWAFVGSRAATTPSIHIANTLYHLGGPGAVYLGIQWQLREESITCRLRRFLPGAMREPVENRA